MAFAVVPAMVVVTMRLGIRLRASWPVCSVAGMVFAINCTRLVFDTDLKSVAGQTALAIVYARQLYLAYYFIRNSELVKSIASIAPYAGHICVMAAAPGVTFDTGGLQ